MVTQHEKREGSGDGRSSAEGGRLRSPSPNPVVNEPKVEKEQKEAANAYSYNPETEIFAGVT
ncbi:hypothetical protein DPMN_030211 [Dreissena polymorpha]|uniref:Uncharacterized protein n=1 Tax=Dreissena polymorpha TaxID=45954 RepID=A0A9D4M272_DREPO|nr:hypothetical protein DPMN_030211 [Dreissena polymorpha]